LVKSLPGKSKRVSSPSSLKVTTNCGASVLNATPNGAEPMATFRTMVPLRSRIVRRLRKAFAMNRKLPLGSKVIPPTYGRSATFSTAKLVGVGAAAEGSMLRIVQVVAAACAQSSPET
jgi:hypothetical protein